MPTKAQIITLGQVMDLICDHAASDTAAFYADVATGAAQAGFLVERLRDQRLDWSSLTVLQLIKAVEEQASEPSKLRVVISGFPLPVELPELQPVSDHATAVAAFRLGRLLLLAFLANRACVWGIDLSYPTCVESISDSVSQAIEVIARFRRVPMEEVEAILQMEAV